MQRSLCFLAFLLVASLAFGSTNTTDAKTNDAESATLPNPDASKKIDHSVMGGLMVVWGLSGLALPAWYFYDLYKARHAENTAGGRDLPLASLDDDGDVEMVDMPNADPGPSDLQPASPLTKKLRAILLARRIFTSLLLIGDALGLEITASLFGGIGALMPSEAAKTSYTTAWHIGNTLAVGVVALAATGAFTDLVPKTRSNRILTYGVIPATSILFSGCAFFASAVFFDAAKYATATTGGT